MQTANEQVTLDFMDCWRRYDLAGALSRISDDAVFTPDPTAKPVVGREAIAQLWSDYMAKMKSYDFEFCNLAGSERVVFFERIENIGTSTGVSLRLPIVGVFEFDDLGKIKSWRDYWDSTAPQGAPSSPEDVPTP